MIKRNEITAKEKELRERTKELDTMEKYLLKQQKELYKREAYLEQKEEYLEGWDEEIKQKEKFLNRGCREAKKSVETRIKELEKKYQWDEAFCRIIKLIRRTREELK